MPPFQNTYAVIIGISDYQNGITPLKTAANDAQALAHCLETDYQYATTLLLDSQATQANLTDWFQSKLPNLVKADDRLLFYFAGHGIALNKDDDGPQGYLIPQDAKLGDSTTYLPMQKVAEALAGLTCRHCLIILDCCFAGAFHWSNTRRLAAVSPIIHKERYDRFIQDPAWQVITSASHDQAAWDSLELKDDRGTDAQKTQHSPFAAALLDALQGDADAHPPAEGEKPSGDGVLTATELYLYLRDRVEVPTEERNGRQTPGLWCLKKHDKGEYIFLIPGHELNLPPAPPLDLSKNPYRGLESFEEQNSELFFGRTQLTQQLYEVVATHPLTVVLGASGSGKSSLVKAGLLSYLHQGDRQQTWAILPPFRPGKSPFKALNLALEKVNLPGLAPSEQAVAEDHLTSTERLAAWFNQYPQSHILVVVDQFEELVTLCSEKQEREQFLQELVAAIQAYPNQFHCVLTLRSDFEPQFRDTLLEPYWQDARFLVPAMTREELREAIEKPALARVVYFEPHALVEQLIDEVSQMPGALPLLSFTLSELYLMLANRYREAQNQGEIIDRAITQADYDQLGGVTRSLTQRADREYEALVHQDPAYAETIRHVMLRMVVAEGVLTRRQVLSSELEYLEPENTRVQAVLQRFLEMRLLVSGTTIEGQSYVEPAHDVLVRGWQRLLNWKQKNLKSLLLQRELTPDAMKWAAERQAKQANGLLWNGDPRLPLLEEVRNSEVDNWLNVTETRFIDRSIQRGRNNRLLRWVIAIGVGSALLLFGLNASNEQRRANENGQKSFARQLAAQSEAIRESDEPLTSSVLVAMESLNGMQTAGLGALPEGITALLNSMSLLAYQETTPLKLGDVERAVLSPDGRYVATTSQGADIATKHRVEVKEISNGRSIAKLNTSGDVTAVVFSPDSKSIVTTSGTIVQVWDLAGQQEKVQIDSGQGINIVSLSSNGQFLITASRGDQTAQLWDLSRRKQVGLIDHGANLTGISFSPDSRWVATSGGTKAQIWQIKRDAQTLSIRSQATLDHQETDTVLSATYSHDGTLLATSSMEGVQIWDASSKRVVMRLNQDQPVRTTVFSPDDQFVATAGFASDNGTAQIWEVGSGKELSRLSHEAGLFDLAYSANGETLITTSREGQARTWQLSSQREVTRLEHQPGVTDITYSPNGKYVATAGGRTVQLWEVSSGRLLVRINAKEFVTSVTYSPNSRFVAIATGFNGKQDSTQIWEISDEEVAQAQKSATLPYKANLLHLAYSPDGKLIATAGGDSTARIWEISSGQQTTLVDHRKPATAVAYSPDGKYLATASDDGTARIWEVSSGQQVALMDHRKAVTAVAYSPDGRFIATASRDRTARIWQVKTGKEVTRMNHRKMVTAIAYSADGKFVATASGKTAQVWDAHSGQQVALMNHERTVRAVAFSPDGKFVATASLDGIARIWVQPAANLQEETCNRLDRNFTAEEWEQYMGMPLSEYHKTCQNLPVHPSLLVTGKALAESGNVAAAIAIFQRVYSLEPTTDLNPTTQVVDTNPRSVAEQLSVPAKVEAAAELLQAGAVSRAITALKKAEALNPKASLFAEAEIWNRFCWFGSLQGGATEVMFACEKAVSLKPKGADVLSSRGIARALNGDLTGAIADFQASLPAVTHDEEKAQRRRWVEVLQSGQNPFTKAELARLQQDHLE